MSTTGLANRLAASTAALPPAAFALVMATGIVADVTRRLGLAGLPHILLWFSAGCYVILASLLLARTTAFPRRIMDDMRHAARAPDFLTITAGSCVLGGELILIEGSPTAGAILWLVGIATWIALIYAIIVVLVILPQKQGLGEEFDGNWLLLVVAAQSIAVLGAILADHATEAREVVLDCALLFFLLGALFYGAFFALLLHRLLFFPLKAATLTPPYWISMGAAAISVFAGSLLVRHADLSPLLALLRPFLAGLTLLFWAGATWWIPLLLMLGAWRHLRHRVPLHYTTQYWAIVFPLGMYAVATLRLHDDVGWPILTVLGQIFGYAALAAWALATVGVARAVLQATVE